MVLRTETGEEVPEARLAAAEVLGAGLQPLGVSIRNSQGASEAPPVPGQHFPAEERDPPETGSSELLGSEVLSYPMSRLFSGGSREGPVSREGRRAAALKTITSTQDVRGREIRQCQTRAGRGVVMTALCLRRLAAGGLLLVVLCVEQAVPGGALLPPSPPRPSSSL